MSFFKTYMLLALMCISFSFTEQAGSQLADQNNQNKSMVGYPFAVPVKILKALVGISDNSKGLLYLWRKSFKLTDPSLLKAEYTEMKYKVCRGAMFHKVPKYTVCQKDTTSLKRSQLVDYYNELVIQLRIAENFINTSISREIQESKRTQVEEVQGKVIELLRENILPLIDVVLNTTDDEVDCNRTEIIVNKKTSLYSQYCASIQTANLFLSQNILDLYRIFNSIYMAHKNNIDDDQDNEMIIDNHNCNETKVWCILQ